MKKVSETEKIYIKNTEHITLYRKLTSWNIFGNIKYLND